MEIVQNIDNDQIITEEKPKKQDRRSITSKANARKAGLAKVEKQRERRMLELIASEDSSSSSSSDTPSSSSGEAEIAKYCLEKKKPNSPKKTVPNNDITQNEFLVKKIDSLEKMILGLGQVVKKNKTKKTKEKKRMPKTKIINVLPASLGGHKNDNSDVSSILKNNLLKF